MRDSKKYLDDYNYHDWSKFMVQQPSEKPKGPHFAGVLFDKNRAKAEKAEATWRVKNDKIAQESAQREIDQLEQQLKWAKERRGF